MVSNSLPMYLGPRSRRLASFIRWAACTVGTVLFGAVCVSAQAVPPVTLEPSVIGTVNRFYPGFTEILEARDPGSLIQLASVLAANPGRESLDVLLWMLEHCPSWADGNGNAVLQIQTLARAAGTLPVAALLRTLVRGNPDQRLTAAIALGGGRDGLIVPADRQQFEQPLIAALSDTYLPVREWVAPTLRALNTPAGNLALTEALDRPDVTDTFYDRATGQRRPFRLPRVSANTFPPEAVAAVSRIAPGFLSSLNSASEQGLVYLRQTLERSADPNVTPVLAWMLIHERGSDWYLPQVLAAPQRVAKLPWAELGSLLATGDADHRSSIAAALRGALERPNVPASSATELVRVLMSYRSDPRVDVRVNVLTVLASAMTRDGTSFRGAAPDIVHQLVSLLREGDLAADDLAHVVTALGKIGDPTTLPELERIAHSLDRPSQVREEAARVYLALSRSADPVGERRRLLWEQPDTSLEDRVRTEGRRALALVWRTLASGSTRERRAAAALLGWYRDVGSIRPLLTALDTDPGTLTQQQLLFDLNMILLTEAPPADPAPRNGLATSHLEWLYGQLAGRPMSDQQRKALIGATTIAVLPDRVTGPLSVPLSATTVSVRGQPSTQISSRAVVSGSGETFRASLANDRYGVAFHAIRIAEGVARVATTVYMPPRGATRQVWISLYRQEGSQWVRLPLPPNLGHPGTQNEPNLLPTIQRNYGADDPLKALYLDIAMEDLRGNLAAVEELAKNGGRLSVRPGSLGASDVPLLERYRQSDDPSVRYTAELQWGRLTGRPNIQLWLDALAQQRGSPFQTLAQLAVAPYALSQIKAAGRPLAAAERDELMAAAMTPAAVDERFLPRVLPQREQIRQVQRSTLFATVDVVVDSETRGYSMLFARRNDHWVFLFVTGNWIS